MTEIDNENLEGSEDFLESDSDDLDGDLSEDVNDLDDGEGDEDFTDEDDLGDEPDEDLDDDLVLEDDSEEITDDDSDDNKEEDPADKTEAEKEDNSKPEETAAPEISQAGDLSLEDELKTRILPEYVPGSKEFVTATAAKAKAIVAEKLGEEFDQFDADHLSAFNYHLNEIQAEHKAEYHGAIEIVKTERQQREAQKSIADRKKEAVAQVDEILKTPAQKKSFNDLIESMSKNSRGDYLVLVEDLNMGKTDSLIALAKKVAGPHSEVLKPQPKKKALRPGQEKKKGEVVGSDILGF